MLTASASAPGEMPCRIFIRQRSSSSSSSSLPSSNPIPPEPQHTILVFSQEFMNKRGWNVGTGQYRTYDTEQNTSQATAPWGSPIVLYILFWNSWNVEQSVLIVTLRIHRVYRPRVHVWYVSVWYVMFWCPIVVNNAPPCIFSTHLGRGWVLSCRSNTMTFEDCLSSIFGNEILSKREDRCPQGR